MKLSIPTFFFLYSIVVVGAKPRLRVKPVSTRMQAAMNMWLRELFL